MTYEPREDSAFLASFVRAHARGRVLDLGTGSGILARTARSVPGVTGVVAVDIDPAAVALAREQGFLAVQSDLFENLRGEVFDTIVCNPPYLPDEQQDESPALYGGPGGYEFIERLIGEFPEHLAEGGQLLLLFSSLTNKERVDLLLRPFTVECLGELALFFERLYAYRIRCN